MDKIKLTNHIKDIDLKNKMFKVIDKANSCLKHYDVKCTDFLNPYEIKNAIAILNSFNDIKYSVDGGYDNAERKVIFIYPYYMEYEDIECPLEIVQVEGNFKFKEISHKDYLGAILNLGIVREKIGDIAVRTKGAEIVIKKEVEKFLEQALRSLTRFQNAEVEIASIEELQQIEAKKLEITDIVASLRLDNIVSDLVKTSRSKAKQIIEQERVFVNGQNETKMAKQVKIGNIITIRGKGRFIVKEQTGTTRSGRAVLKIEKYV